MTNWKTGPLPTCLLAVLALGGSNFAHATVVVDRGLPDQNLNNAAGGDRSNVAWGFNGDFLAGDDFSLGALNPGKRAWQIDQLTLWTIGGEATLGDRFESVTLFLGAEGASSIPAAASANLTGNNTDNSDIEVSNVNYPGTSTNYQGSGGGFLNIWQIDFFDLGLFGSGQHLFALGGAGGPITFNHASNAALSGTPQDGSDDSYRWFSGSALDPSIAPGGFIDSDGYGWDKSSDINIQVRATQVPEPSILGLMGLGLLGLLAARRRSTQA
ncbi:MAG: PEP-CTERM sorting domain-containing protein [Halofilum sp. (in: g-proteobacteria)]|nr:PEP-CTERM sorting domain-containing protein [Halofilum sp. (in: g-proteobacteria)]